MKRIKFLFITILVLSFVLTGCQNIGPINFNEMLTKDVKDPLQTFEIKESISLQVDYDESVLNEEDLKVLNLLSNARLDLHIQKNNTMTKIDGALVLDKGEVPFVVTSNADETIVWIDNAVKPFVYKGNLIEEYQRNLGIPYDYVVPESSLDPTELSTRMVDIIVNNLPNLSELSLNLYNRTEINGKWVTLNRINSKITGDQLPAYVIQFLNNIKQDQSVKEFLSYLFDYYGTLNQFESEDVTITSEQKEIMLEESYQEFVMGIDNTIVDMEEISEDWIFDERSFLESTLYVDNEMRVVKADNTLTFVTPEELRYDFEGLNGFTLNITTELFNLDQDFAIEPIDMLNKEFITTESSQEEATASLNKEGVFYDLLRYDFKVIPIQTMVLILDTKEVEISYEDKDNQTMTLNVAPYVTNGTTLVPVRFFSENLGAEVIWNGETKEVTIVHEDETIVLPIYSDIAYVNGEEYWLDVKTDIIDGNTMVPLRFISEVFDLDVSWNGELREITIEQYE